MKVLLPLLAALMAQALQNLVPVPIAGIAVVEVEAVCVEVVGGQLLPPHMGLTSIQRP